MKYRCVLCHHPMAHLTRDSLGRDCRSKLASEPYSLDRSVTLALRNLHQQTAAHAERVLNHIAIAANSARDRLGVA